MKIREKKLARLQEEWDKLFEKISELRNDKIEETRREERDRLQRVIDVHDSELETIEAQIRKLEKLQAGSQIEWEFDKISDEEFLETLEEYEDITSIDIVGHTGSHLVRAFFKQIKGNQKLRDRLKKVEVRILLRNPTSETGLRANSIRDVVKVIKYHQGRGFKNLQLHFYQNLPTFRAIICYRKKSNSRSAYISFYEFLLNSVSQRFSHAFIINEENTGKNLLIDLVNSWIEHFWGKTKEERQEIHTIIFDFDDTMVDSHDIQIQAWIETIKEFQPELNQEQFQENIWENINDKNKLWEEIETIFFEAQHAKSIFERIFKDIPEKKADEIHQRRFKIRESRVKEAPLFTGCSNILKKIADKYHLVVISATDEDMIIEYLNDPTFKNEDPPENPNLVEYFVYIFGKGEPIFDWKNLERKSQLILKVISILGVPVERLVYVGDNNNDFKASKDIGINFIEARLFRENSLVRSTEPRECFTHWKEFPNILTRVEQKKKGVLKNS